MTSWWPVVAIVAVVIFIPFFRRAGLTSAFEYLGDRFGLVTVRGQDYYIADIGMRMLQPRELYTAQGFPASYVIDRGADGRPLSKAAQVRMCGNSVCPTLAEALVRANYSERQALRKAA